MRQRLYVVLGLTVMLSGAASAVRADEINRFCPGGGIPCTDTCAPTGTPACGEGSPPPCKLGDPLECLAISTGPVTDLERLVSRPRVITAPRCTTGDLVWAESRSKVFYLPQSRSFATGSKGAFMCRADAVAKRFKPAAAK